MKTFVFFALVACACFIYGSSAVPVADAGEEGVALADVDAAEVGYEVIEAVDEDVAVPLAAPSRQKRATCDLLSAVPNLNHSACAAHCILKRFKGGYCNGKAVCVCRN